MIEAAARFAALGDPIRLSIVRALGQNGPLPSVMLRAQAREVTRQGFAKHLAVLERAGLVESRRAGRDMRWQIKAGEIEQLRALLEGVSAAWDSRIESLRALVEE